MASTFSTASADALLSPRFKVEIGGGSVGAELAVHEFMAHERTSAPFEVTLVVRSHSADIDLEDVVGHPAAFGYRSEDDQVVAWSGVCSYMEQLQAETSSTGLSTYRLSIVPKLWLLTQRRRSRIYQYDKSGAHLTLPDIVKLILADYEIEARWDLTDAATYPRHDMEVQYEETDFAFVSRMLEEAGITYFFEKVLSGDKAESRLVLVDRPEKAPSLGEIRFHDQPNVVRSERFVTGVHIAHDVRPGKVTLRDYDLRRPQQTMEEASALSLSGPEAPEEKYEKYHYWPGVSLIEATADGQTPVADERGAARHKNDEEKARAQRTAEAIRNAKRHVEFDSNEKELEPGKVFSISDHPHDEIAPGQKLLVVETIVTGTVKDWRLVGVAVFVDDKLRYRPKLRTPKPRVMGYQTALVTGPGKDEIHADEFGRVRVRFHWDRISPFDETSSCWLRVSQQWAGAGFGWSLVPRVGQEVVVDFFEGDPNQPAVIGRVHNLTQTVPRSLPRFMTQSTWRSASTPFKDGWFNEIMIDDDAGKELVFVQAQRDHYKLVKHDETERTGKLRTTIVGAARVAAVASRDSHQVGKQHLINVVSVSDLKIPEMGEPQFSAKKTFTEMVDGKITLTTGRATVVLDGADILVDAEGGVQFSADGELIMQGSTIYLNQKATKRARPKVSPRLLDPVKKPDRMLKSVDKLFWQKQEGRKLMMDNVWVALPCVPTPPPPAQSVALAAEPNEPATSRAAVERNEARAAARRHVAQYFYETQGTTWDAKAGDIRPFDPKSQADRDMIDNQLDGIDFTQPVVATTTPPPDNPSQWQKPGGNKGNYFAEMGTAPTKLGISDFGPDGTTTKVCKTYVIVPGTPTLRSTASPQPDSWSVGGAVHETTGGATQYYIGATKACTEPKPTVPPAPLTPLLASPIPLTPKPVRPT